jgi:hypothetical protein
MTFVSHKNIIFLAPTLHLNPPIINLTLPLYARMSNVNDSFEFPRNSWWWWAYLVGGAHGKVAVIGLHTVNHVHMCLHLYPYFYKAKLLKKLTNLWMTSTCFNLRSGILIHPNRDMENRTCCIIKYQQNPHALHSLALYQWDLVDQVGGNHPQASQFHSQAAWLQHIGIHWWACSYSVSIVTPYFHFVTNVFVGYILLSTKKLIHPNWCDSTKEAFQLQFWSRLR